MKLTESLRNRAKSLKMQLTSVYYAYLDPRVTWLPKAIIAVSIGYALSPVDLIPDFIPVIGLLDDFIVVPALISLAIGLIPVEVMDDARRRANREPLSLKKNWFFGSVFIAIWASLLAWAMYTAFRIFFVAA